MFPSESVRVGRHDVIPRDRRVCVVFAESDMLTLTRHRAGRETCTINTEERFVRAVNKLSALS